VIERSADVRKENYKTQFVKVKSDKNENYTVLNNGKYNKINKFYKKTEI